MKLSSSPKEFGVHSENPDILAQRYRVSDGVVQLGLKQAVALGYSPREIAGAVTIPRVDMVQPLDSLRKPTERELKDITAEADTKRVMRIVRLGQAVVEQLRERCIDAKVKPHMQIDEYQELLPGIWGLPASVREDQANQLSVSISTVHFGTKVGEHIDEWADPSTSFLIANMGPGERWHRVTPEINRDAIRGATHTSRAKYLEAHPDPSSIPVHWFKLEPPRDGCVEAIVGSPVAWARHDGSTIGSNEPSEAVMCRVDPIPPGHTYYPSVV